MTSVEQTQSLRHPWLVLIITILAIGLITERSPKFGGFLLVAVVLGMVFMASAKGFLKD